METKIIPINENHIDREALRPAAEILASGGLVAFPTETVYGLGANALDEEAVQNIFKAKGRPSDNPLIVHIAEKADILSIAAQIPKTAEMLMDAFFPGPLTLILPKREEISSVVTAGLSSVAVRMPVHPVARELIRLAGVPVAAPSANLSGKPSPTEARYVAEDMDGRIDAIIDGGACSVGVESTVVDLTGSHAVLLRPGGVTFEQIQAILPDAEIDRHVLCQVTAIEKPKSPGMKYKHYAPDAEVTVVEGEEGKVHERITHLCHEAKKDGKRVGVLSMGKKHYRADCVLSGGTTSREYAKRLFSALREFDKRNIDIVFVEYKEEGGMGLAVKNRLYKSAGGNVIHV